MTRISFWRPNYTDGECMPRCRIGQHVLTMVDACGSLTQHRLFFEVRGCDRIRAGSQLPRAIVDLAIFAR